MEPALLQKLKGKFKKPEELPPIKLEDTESEEEEIDPAEAVKPAHVHSLLEHVFLTSMETINSHPDIDSELRSRNITHVLYLGPVNQVVIPRVIQCSISSEDKQNFDLLSHFDRTVAFMENARRLGGLLLIDKVGGGEAGAVFVAYLMRLGLCYRDAMTYLARRVKQARPNFGFQGQLHVYEAMRDDVGHQDIAIEDMFLLFPELDTREVRKQEQSKRDHLVRMHTLSRLKGYRQTTRKREFEAAEAARKAAEEAELAALLAAEATQVDEDELFKESGDEVVAYDLDALMGGKISDSDEDETKKPTDTPAATDLNATPMSQRNIFTDMDTGDEWEQCFDSASGEINLTTQATQWQLPASAVPGSTRAAARAAPEKAPTQEVTKARRKRRSSVTLAGPVKGMGWCEMFDMDALEIYYYNNLTGETSWEPPPGYAKRDTANGGQNDATATNGSEAGTPSTAAADEAKVESSGTAQVSQKGTGDSSSSDSDTSSSDDEATTKKPPAKPKVQAKGVNASPSPAPGTDAPQALPAGDPAPLSGVEADGEGTDVREESSGGASADPDDAGSETKTEKKSMTLEGNEEQKGDVENGTDLVVSDAETVTTQGGETDDGRSVVSTMSGANSERSYDSLATSRTGTTTGSRRSAGKRRRRRRKKGEVSLAELAAKQARRKQRKTRYLYNQAEFIVCRSSNAVSRVFFALDGAHVLCSDHDGNVKMMIWRSGGLVARLCQSRVEQTHRAWCLDCCFSLDRQRTIYTLSFNGDCKIWKNPSYGSKVPGTNAMVPLTQHLPGKLNFATAPASHQLAPHCCRVAASHGCQRLITTAENGLVRVYGLPTVRFKDINRVPIQPQKRPPGMSVLASYKGLHFTWDPAGNPITVPVSALQWGAEDKVIISGGLDGKVHVWTSDMGYIKSLPLSDKPRRARRVVQPKKMRLDGSLKQPKVVREKKEPKKKKKKNKLGPRSKTAPADVETEQGEKKSTEKGAVVSGGKMKNGKSAKLKSSLKKSATQDNGDGIDFSKPPHHGPVYDITLNKEGSMVAVAYGNGTVQMWDLQHAQLLWEIQATTRQAGRTHRKMNAADIQQRAIDRFDASRREQFSKSDKDKRAETKKQRELERQARARERAEREERRNYKNPKRLIGRDGIAKKLKEWPAVNTLVFSPNEKLLAIGTQDAWIKVVDPLTGFSVCETDVEAEVMCVAFHPFEEFLAASTSNGKISVFEIKFKLSGMTKFCSVM